MPPRSVARMAQLAKRIVIHDKIGVPRQTRSKFT